MERNQFPQMKRRGQRETTVPTPQIKIEGGTIIIPPKIKIEGEGTMIPSTQIKIEGGRPIVPMGWHWEMALHPTTIKEEKSSQTKRVDHGGTNVPIRQAVVTYRMTLLDERRLFLCEEFYVPTLKEAYDQAIEYFYEKFRFGGKYNFTNVEIVRVQWRCNSRAQYCARCEQMFPMIYKSIYKDSQYYDQYICDNCWDWGTVGSP